MEVVGTVGAIVGIIDVAGRSISVLIDIRNRFKEVQFTVNLLLTKLVSVKTALDQIKKLIEEGLEHDQYYEVVINMDIVVGGCNLLVRVLDDQLAQLEYDEHDRLTWDSRVRMVLESKGVEQCSNRLDSQMLALNLLVTVLNARTALHQKEIMEEKPTQKVFEQVKEDSSSLYVLVDTDSFATRRTRTTTATSKFSKIFDFDSELLRHRAYQSTFRSLMRRSGRGKGVGTEFSNTSAHPSLSAAEKSHRARVSLQIDEQLTKDKRANQMAVTILMVGPEAHKVLRNVHFLWPENGTTEELIKYTMVIQQHLLTLMRKCMEMPVTKWKSMKDDLAYHTSVLNSVSDDVRITKNGNVEAFKTVIWVMELVLAKSIPLDPIDNFYIAQADRLLQPDYVPTAKDIIMLPSPSPWLSETRLFIGPMQYHLVQIPDSMFPRRPKHLQLFQDVTAILFAVDLASYDQVAFEPSDTTQMTETLNVFDSIINNKATISTAVILFFCNVSNFKQKIALSPIARYFPEYSGGDDADRALQYLCSRFVGLNQGERQLYTHITDLPDTSTFRFLIGCCNDVIIEEMKRLCGLK